MDRQPFSRCRYGTCNAEIAFVSKPDGSGRMPVDIESLSDEDVEEFKANPMAPHVKYRHGEHISHHATCAGLDRNRKPKKAAG